MPSSPRILVTAFVVITAAAIHITTAQDNGGLARTITPRAVGDVNLVASRVFIFVDKEQLGHVHAVEGELASGRLSLDHGPAIANELVFNMASFTADTVRARTALKVSGEVDEATRSQIDSTLKGTAVLDVTQFPTAKFQVTQLQSLAELDAQGRRNVEISGDFTLHGVTRAIRFVVAVETYQGWRRITGRFKIKQSDYGITPYSKGFGLVGVADELVIYGDLYVLP